MALSSSWATISQAKTTLELYSSRTLATMAAHCIRGGSALLISQSTRWATSKCSSRMPCWLTLTLELVSLSCSSMAKFRRAISTSKCYTRSLSRSSPIPMQCKTWLVFHWSWVLTCLPRSRWLRLVRRNPSLRSESRKTRRKGARKKRKTETPQKKKWNQWVYASPLPRRQCSRVK